MDENNSNNNEEVVENQQDIQENEPQVKQEVHTVNNTNNKTIKKTIEKTEKVKGKDKNQKRSGDRIVVQYRKPSIFSSVLLVLIGALIAVIICMVLYIWKIKPSHDVDIYKDNTSNVEQNNDSENISKEDETKKDLDLSLDGDFVKDLKSKIPINKFSQVIYNYKKTTEAYLTGNQKMLFVLENMRENKQYTEVSAKEILDRLDQYRIMNTSGDYISVADKFDVNDVDKNFKSVFGSSKDIIKEDIETNAGYIYEYDETDDCYYGHFYAGGGGGGPLYFEFFDSVDASSDQKEIYVYDYYIMVQGNDRKWDIYNRSNSNAIGEESEDPTTYNKEERKTYLKDGIFEKYKDKLVKFKHTFVLDDNGNYYWYSCEPTSQI